MESINTTLNASVNSKAAKAREPWNKGKLIGQKAPFKVKDIWAIRTRLQMGGRIRDLALFDLGLDSKLRGCDLMKLKVRDICHGEQVAPRATVMQQKTQRPVQFEISPPHAKRWLRGSNKSSCDRKTICFQAVYITHRLWARASTRECWTDG